MQKKYIEIDGIPAILWGATSRKLFIAVHGDQSSKEDIIIAMFAKEAVKRGYQTLSFDLPEHGDYKKIVRRCDPINGVEDLKKIMDYAHKISDERGLFGCSIGAYFSMLSYEKEKLIQTLFLSPVSDMKFVIENMMTWFNISEQQLEQQGEIITPIKTIYWDYYKYVVEHPVTWDKPTKVLCGEKDTICDVPTLKAFFEKHAGNVVILENGEHYFHTDTQLDVFRRWLIENIS